jgi:alpha-mannosidase
MYWKSALIQHPMFLIIKEDTDCAERTPPWGEPSLELYIERVRDNLKRIRKYPHLKIGFEWSGLEVEMLAQEGPDVFEEMRAMAKEGRVAFYNGTYAQPHMQILSPEANIRQFEFGMRVYRELCDYQVVTYAHQETSVHDQSPQIMRAFGMKYSALPQFPSTVHWLDGGEIVMRLQHPHFIQGEDFVEWVGLDGTKIPLYLSPVPQRSSDWVAEQTMYGFMQEPPIMLEIPDLVDVNDEWVESRKQTETVLLDQAFAERLQAYPPRSRVRHFTYWSYIEGIRAEELSRRNWTAEKAALQAESLDALAFALMKRPVRSTDPIWKQILTTQHHDVYCFCAPVLREKSVGWLQEATANAQQISLEATQAVAAQVDTTAQQGTPAIIFNTVPAQQKRLATLETDVQNPVLVNASGDRIPAETRPGAGGGTSVKFVTTPAGLGYETYWLREGDAPAQEIEITEPFTFENDFYRAVLQPDGTISSLKVKPSGDELLAAPGNSLKATDTTGIGPREMPGLHNRAKWQIPEAGAELTWQPTSNARLLRSPLGASITVTGRLSDQVRGTLSIHFYNDLQRIDLAHQFSFDSASIGSFYLDETKLRVQYPLAFAGSISHDIAFGVVQTQVERPIHPTSWVDVSDGAKGLAYFHKGTFKHWVKNNTLVNLFAWGEETNAIGSRMWRPDWNKCFDQRLNGTHTIETALYPHAGDWRAAEVNAAAQSFGTPLFVSVEERHEGSLPSSLNLLNIANPQVSATMVKAENGALVCRAYSLATEPTVPNVMASGLKVSALQALDRSPISALQPFQIGLITLSPE